MGALESRWKYYWNIEITLTEDPLRDAARYVQRGFRPVLLYGLSTVNAAYYLDEVAEVSRRYMVIVGGPHAAGDPHAVLSTGARYAVVGDAEPALPALLDHALFGEGELGKVPNLAYVEGGRVKFTRRETADLDGYRPYTARMGIYPPIEVMRGCGHACTFCQVPYLAGGRPRYRSVHSVLEAVKAYVAAGKRHIRFVSPNSFAYLSPDGRTANPGALEELLAGVRGLGARVYYGSFPSETRPETVTDEAMRAVARHVSNRRIVIGLQSGSGPILGRVNRGHGVEEAFNAVATIRRWGFLPVVDVIMGLPGEGEGDVRATVDAMERLVAMGARIRLHRFIPLAGTPLWGTPIGEVHPLYRRFIRRYLGRGVLEGEWEEQEGIVRLIMARLLGRRPLGPRVG